MTTNKTFATELEKRTKKFALSIISLVALLPKTMEANVIRNQILRSGTSIGANYREANRSVSRADFRNKIAICEKEASETQYWLELISESHLLPEQKIHNIYLECSELLALFTTIGKNSR